MIRSPRSTHHGFDYDLQKGPFWTSRRISESLVNNDTAKVETKFVIMNWTKPRKMEEIDLVSKDTVADLIKQKFESPLPKCQDDDDPFVKVTHDMIKMTIRKLMMIISWDLS